MFSSRFIAVACAVASLSLPVFAASEKPARFVASGESVIDAAGRKVYIVQLEGDGAIEAALRESRVQSKPGRAFHASPGVAAKAARLGALHAGFPAKIGPGAELVYSYRYSMNGFAVRMTPFQASVLRREPGVVAIWEDATRKLATNSSPAFLGLFSSDGGLIGDLGLSGENVVIAVIDSGITPEHPSFSDTEKPQMPRLCQGSFGESLLGQWLCRRFEVREARLTYEPLADWNGICEAGEDFAADDCNNKLIGARFFSAGAIANQQIDANELFSPRDTDGHGTHIASTAAGNRVMAKINGANVARIRGMAPRARIAAYKACWLKPGAVRASCNTSDLAAAIDAAVADGVDIISYSVGNDERTVASADALALLAATKAGIFTAVAAGNTGPALGTIGSPGGSPWVTTVAASSRAGEIFEEAIEIVTPGTLAGKIASREANFTEPLSSTGTIEDELVLVDDGDPTTDAGTDTGSTDDGCQAFDNAADISGKVRLHSTNGLRLSHQDRKRQRRRRNRGCRVFEYRRAGRHDEHECHRGRHPGGHDRSGGRRFAARCEADRRRARQQRHRAARERAVYRGDR